MTGRIVSASSILMIAMLLSGCGIASNKPIVTYERDSATVPQLSVVGHQGLYTLFPGNGVTPLAAVYLLSGDKFGFQNQDGKVVGVYVQSDETKSVPLDGVLTTEYVWKYQGDKKP
jgi:hypothetical protein